MDGNGNGNGNMAMGMAMVEAEASSLDSEVEEKDSDSTCYDPGPLFSFFSPFILRSWSLVPHLFPYAPLGPPPNHLTSHLMDHLTIPQSDITCHHPAVRSILQHHHLTLYGLPAHCHVMMRPPAHDEAILRTASS